jgi:hypothetical protein
MKMLMATIVVTLMAPVIHLVHLVEYYVITTLIITFYMLAVSVCTPAVTIINCLYLGFVSPCIFIHSNELIPTRCSN